MKSGKYGKYGKHDNWSLRTIASTMRRVGAGNQPLNRLRDGLAFEDLRAIYGPVSNGP